MNTQLLLKASIEELRLLQTEMAAEIRSKKALLKQTSERHEEGSGEHALESLLTPEIELLEGESMIIERIILHKQGQSYESREQVLEREVQSQQRKIETLLEMIDKYKLLENNVRQYVEAQQQKQKQLSDEREAKLIENLIQARTVRTKYEEMPKSGFLGWLSQSDAHTISCCGKSRKRHQQVDLIENIAKILANDTLLDLQLEELEEVLLSISQKVGIGFESLDRDSLISSSTDLDIEERTTLIRLTKSLILLGALNTVRDEIINETNLASSRLFSVIDPMKHQLKYDVSFLSSGVIDASEVYQKSIDAYRAFEHIRIKQTVSLKSVG